MGKEVRVNPLFEEKFKDLCKYLEREFGCPEFKIEESEFDKIDNNRFESDILKCAICHAFGISMYSGNPWFSSFNILRSEESLGYHGSAANTISITYDISFPNVIGYNIYNLLTISEDQIDFIKTFREKYQVLFENLKKIKSDCFPIIINE